MLQKLYRILPVVVMLAMLATTAALAAPVQQAEMDIVDTAVADGRFTTLASALEAAELVETLKGEGPFTVFAPTDDAFAALPEGALDGLLADVPALTDVLLYHVVAGQVMAADVVTLESADTVLGQPLSISVDGDTVMVGNAQVILTDIETSNGVIHVIDAVLLPPSDDAAMEDESAMMDDSMATDLVDIADTAVADGRFTTLVSALEAAGLVETLKGEGPFTVFAPTDDAFAALPEGTLESLLANIPALTDILLYHVVPGQVMAADVAALSSADTAMGQPLTISVDGETVMVDGAQVILTDIAASNGVIHVIDSVLIPASDEAPMAEESAMAEPATVVEGCENYTVQADDWLSRIAERFLGDVLAYPAIVEATNNAAAEGAYDVIDNPDVIEIGQVLCVPTGENMMMDEGAMMDEDAAMEEDAMMEEDAAMDDSAAMDEGAMMESMDIVDTAVADGRFNTLATALEAANLVETLKGEGPFTVFAPTDDAFAALPEGALDGLLADIPALTDVLLYHVVAGQVMAADVVTLSSADTVLGQPVSIMVDGDTVTVGDAQVILTDIAASNGVIHVIDSVLLPPPSNYR